MEGVETQFTNSEGKDTKGLLSSPGKGRSPRPQPGTEVGMTPGTSAVGVPRPSFYVPFNMAWLLSLCRCLFALLLTHSVSRSLHSKIPKGNLDWLSLKYELVPLWGVTTSGPGSYAPAARIHVPYGRPLQGLRVEQKGRGMCSKLEQAWSLII